MHRLTLIQTVCTKWKKQTSKNKMFLQWKIKNHRYYKNCSKGEYKIIKSVNSNCILMEESSHSFIAQILPGNSIIVFRIFLVFVAHFFQTDFILEINSFLFSKRVFNLFRSLLLSLCSRNDSPGYYILVISEAIDLIWCNVVISFLTKSLEQDYFYMRAHYLG